MALTRHISITESLIPLSQGGRAMANHKPDMTEKDANFLSTSPSQEEAAKRWPKLRGNPSGTDWMLRVSQSNPDPCNTSQRREMTHSDIESCLEKASFMVFQLEEGKENGYRHYQIFVQFPSATRLSSIRKSFNSKGFSIQFIAPRQFSVSSCLAYCSKESTRIEGPWSHGEAKLPATDSKQLLLEAEQQLSDGTTSVATLLLNPETRSACRRHLNYLRAIEEAALKDKWSKTDRDVTTHLLYGPPRTGKTWSLTHSLYTYEDVYRVTDWKNPWDSYQGQKVLILDEFAAQPDFHLLCQILEGYPLELPARYMNKWAAWNEVWIISNENLQNLVSLYEAQGVSAEMLPSLPGRIGEVIHHTAPGIESSYIPKEYQTMKSMLNPCQGASMTSPLDPGQSPSGLSQTNPE